MTTDHALLPHPATILLGLLATGASVVSLVTYFTIYAVLPTRMDRVEDTNKIQDAKIAVIESDNVQRREMLAAALATLAQIDQRTKRIEDKLLR